MANTVNITIDKASMGLDQVNNTSDINKPISTATQTALNGKEDLANKSTDVSLGTSNTLYPTQNAVKVYTDNLLGNSNALVYKGVVDCSTNPNYPSANAGELYIVSVAGKIGGASGVNVEVGDMLICNTDSTASGDQATVGNYWNAIQKNIDGAVTGPSSSANNKVAVFDGTTGKLLKEGVITDNGSNVGIGINTPTASLHINNVTTDASFLVEDETSPDSSPFIINNVGEVGIGTSSPTVKLELNANAGAFKMVGTNHIYQTFYPQGIVNGRFGYIGYASTNTKNLSIVNESVGGNIVFSTESINRITINNTGDVNISTINNATTNTDKFLVSDSGVVKHRTASQLKSDLTLDQVNNTSDANKPISSATQTALDNKSDKNITLDRKTASYTLVANDNGKMIEMNVASANTLTINASLFSAGNQILISQYGAGQTTITAGAGVTLRSSGGKLKTSAQYSLVTIIAISSTEFYVAGDLTA